MTYEEQINQKRLERESTIRKSLAPTWDEIKTDIIKAKKAEIGTISTHGGVKVRKEANGWVPVKGEKSTPKGEDQPAEKTGEPADLGEHAKSASEAALQNAIKNSPDSEVRAAAHKELERRTKEEKTEMFSKPEGAEPDVAIHDKEVSGKVAKDSGISESEFDKLHPETKKELLAQYKKNTTEGSVKKEATPKSEPKKEDTGDKRGSESDDQASTFTVGDKVKISSGIQSDPAGMAGQTVEVTKIDGDILHVKNSEGKEGMYMEDTAQKVSKKEPTKEAKKPESEVVSSASSFKDYLKDQNINQLSYGGKFYVDKKDYKALVDQFKDAPGYYSYDKGSIVGERFTFGTGFGVLPSQDMQKEKDRLTKLESKFEASIDKARERTKEKLEKLKRRVPKREDINKKHSWNFSEKGYQKLIEDYHQEMMETGSTYSRSDFLNFADVANLPEYFEKSLSEDRHSTYQFLEGQSNLLQKSHINEFILSDSFSVSKTGIELKQRFEEQLKLELEEIRENSRKASELMTEIGSVPDCSFEDEYYYMIDGYEDKIQSLPMVFKRDKDSTDLGDSKWEYNSFARKIVDGMIEVLHLNTLLNTIVDGKQYKLTVKQASILGY